ncbi:type I-E CRISPR-associated protein Cas6/Cse3/CasE [Streptomyces sp. BE147]|uniref:type I-E CRISPR-associated protein Cas6/Cse3/CasE n=1 Tax=Streptomyces sp. BE147 TaxID=3002524 RepID=UPI002E77AA4B|nr:type I-E CRISPR-associated protein Cas6/Cse3/CasE [Streptomyces sp. BE147]MEE1742276.1 type I-E CRISPR-associated protein Cas6/Cse3/CasE [Streptomyces sp. BE147]
MTIRPAATFTTVRSALTLTPREQERCNNVHHLHALVLSGFPVPAPTGAAPTPRRENVLYAAHRGDPLTDRQHRLLAAPPERVLVQAPVQPEWQPLINDGRLTRADVFPVEHLLRAGEFIAIRVIANPVLRNLETGKRLSLTAPHDATDWMRRHLTRIGLDAAPGDITTSERVRITGSRRGRPLTVVCRDTAARGRVRDPELLVQALTTGIGPAKAYGCGLLRIHLTEQNEEDKIAVLV